MSDSWSFIVIAALVVFIIMLATGNGDKLSGLFGGKQQNLDAIYDRKKMDRGTLILCVVLLLNELVLYFFGKKIQAVAIGSLIVCILAFAAYIIYLKKCCSRKD